MAEDSTKPKQRRLASFFKEASDFDSESAAQTSTSSDLYSSVHETKAVKSTERKKTVKWEFRSSLIRATKLHPGYFFFFFFFFQFVFFSETRDQSNNKIRIKSIYQTRV